MERLKLRQVLDRLEHLSRNCKNDEMEVSFKLDGCDFYITNAYITQEEDVNFDEANCGPYQFIELNYI